MKPIQVNHLYKSLIKGAKQKFSSGNINKETKPDTIHPVRTLEAFDIMPLDIAFNVGHEALHDKIIQSLINNPSIFEAVEHCSNFTPLIVNELLEGGSETFETQVEGAIKMLLPHAFFLSSAIVLDDEGKLKNTRVFFKPFNENKLHTFGEKERLISGYYVFLGMETHTVVLVGKPLKNNDQSYHIFYDFTVDTFPIKEDIEFLKECFNKKYAEVRGTALIDSLSVANNIKMALNNA